MNTKPGIALPVLLWALVALLVWALVIALAWAS